MSKPHAVSRRWLLLALAAFGFLLACRTADLIAVSPPTRLAQNRTRTDTPAPRAPTRFLPTFTPIVTAVDTAVPPTAPPPATPLPPTGIKPAAPSATHLPAATRAPASTPTPSGPASTSAPTRCPQKYCVVYRGCQPDAGNTLVEGIVYNNGTPENGVVVRAAKAAGGYPVTDDFISGTDPVNPGKPDSNRPGYYILQIVAGAPREGDWWIFVIDRPNGTQQLSEAQLIHTDGTPSPTSCERAFVDFVR